MGITEQRADQLASIAQEFAFRLRDEDPRRVGHWLAGALPHPEDWWQLVFVLGAAVDIDASWDELVAWIRRPAARHPAA